jgi:hypothetical protein
MCTALDMPIDLIYFHSFFPRVKFDLDLPIWYGYRCSKLCVQFTMSPRCSTKCQVNFYRVIQTVILCQSGCSLFNSSFVLLTLDGSSTELHCWIGRFFFWKASAIMPAYIDLRRSRVLNAQEVRNNRTWSRSMGWIRVNKVKLLLRY